MFYRPFSTDAELAELMQAFDSQTLPLLSWTHREHLAVAAVYAKRHGAGAVTWMRAGIQALNAAHGVQNTDTGGYHETLTIAWMELMGQLCRQHPEADEQSIANLAIELFADKRALLAFYSREAIMSVEARRGWVPPDLSPLALDKLEVRNHA